MNEHDYYRQFEPKRADSKSRCVELLSCVELESVDYETLRELEKESNQTICTHVIKLR